MNIGIIADDLTSAADAALPFYNKGASCEVVRKYHIKNDIDVLSVDTNSRNLTQEAACDVVSKLSERLLHKDILLKTIDSTLRGHIKLEIQATFLASKRTKIVIAPAFPASGRTTINGHQYVNGVLVSHSSYSNDPVHPCKHSQIINLVDSSLGECIVLPADANAIMLERAMQDYDVIILDAQTQACLNRLVSYISNPNMVLWVGSVGLSNALAERFEFSNQRKISLGNNKKVLVVIGSANDISIAQKNALDYQQISLDQDINNLNTFADVAVISAPEQNISSSKLLLEQLSQQAANVLRAGNYDALIATGGETTHAILDQLRIESFSIIDEFEAGFPIGISTDAKLPSSLVIGLKAGGFGTPTSLLNAVKKLTR